MKVGKEPWRTILRQRDYPNHALVWQGKNLFAQVTNHKILDFARTDVFRYSMFSVEVDGQPEKFIIDFLAAWILPNTVLGVLGELQHCMSDGRRELCVCGLPDEAFKNFTPPRFSEFIVMYESVKTARDDFKQPQESIE